MKWISNGVIFLIALGLSLVGAEVLFRFLAIGEEAFERGVNPTSKDEIFVRYTEEERDGSLPLYREDQGATCTRVRAGGTSWMSRGDWYHPYYGYRAVYLDEECAKDFLDEGELSVVFIGGSTMGNTYTPNHLTTIDTGFHEAFSPDRDIRSINLGEVGARSTNEIIRFFFEVIPLEPDVVIFLDGYNEFTPLGYGEDPESNYHWIGVDDRVNAPLYFLRDRFIEKSAFLRTALWQTGVLSNPKRNTATASEEEILKAANRYIQNTNYIHQLCEANGIRCFSFLQPTVLSKAERTESEEGTIRNWLLHQPQFQKILERGYEHIRENSPKTIDLSYVLNDFPESAYFDWPHLSKEGNQRVGAAMARAIQERKSSVQVQD